jgi:hypothetical protein
MAGLDLVTLKLSDIGQMLAEGTPPAPKRQLANLENCHNINVLFWGMTCIELARYEQHNKLHYPGGACSPRCIATTLLRSSAASTNSPLTCALTFSNASARARHAVSLL